MHCVYEVTDKIWWIGGSEREAFLVEGAIPMVIIYGVQLHIL